MIPAYAISDQHDNFFSHPVNPVKTFIRNIPEPCLRLLVILPGMCCFTWAGAGDLLNNKYNFYFNEPQRIVSNGVLRYLLLGESYGRVLMIILEPSGTNEMRLITAYDAIASINRWIFIYKIHIILTVNIFSEVFMVMELC